MANKIKLIIQKRNALISQITNLSAILDQTNVDKRALKLRSVRVRELYHAFEDKNDELVILDRNDAHITEFEAIQMFLRGDG